MSELEFRKSSLSIQGECVEVAFERDAVAVRHSQHPDGPIMRFTYDEWAAFIGGVRKGEFDG